MKQFNLVEHWLDRAALYESAGELTKARLALRIAEYWSGDTEVFRRTAKERSTELLGEK